ncbi:microtubule-associated protein tau-like [Limulus polyphemus]|uniref:Microtubule-associated protein n=1 Tax=Limulus polyphemus TaxID=6850 RepID=A0ABM1TSK7_LIMPO|nr:microtubule-associated protein tau-like [Limulus polyphemus]
MKTVQPRTEKYEELKSKPTLRFVPTNTLDEKREPIFVKGIKLISEDFKVTQTAADKTDVISIGSVEVHRKNKRHGPANGETPKSSKISTSTPKKPLSSPRKPPIKNGVTSPTKTKIPPIKAPVGQTPSPNVKNVTSKIGSFQNMKHKPGGGEKKVVTQKLEWSATSKVGSLEKATHRPGGGAKKIQTQKLEWKAESKVGSKSNLKHSPGGGKVKIENRKMEWKATSKIGSLDNIEHKPGGGDVKIKSEKLNFREKASPRIGSVSERGSSVGSETQSPVPSVSPPPSEPPTEIHITEAPPVEKNPPPPQENEDNSKSVVQPTSPTPEKDSNETILSSEPKPTPEEDTPANTATVSEIPVTATAPSVDENIKQEDTPQSY